MERISIICLLSEKNSQIHLHLIKSFLNQTYPNLELLLSYDKNLDFFKRISIKYQNVKIFPLTNFKDGEMKNFLIKKATGSLIAHFNECVIYDENYISNLHENLRSDIDIIKYKNWYNYDIFSKKYLIFSDKSNDFLYSSIYKKKNWENNKFNTKLSTGEDSEWLNDNISIQLLENNLDMLNLYTQGDSSIIPNFSEINKPNFSEKLTSRIENIKNIFNKEIDITDVNCSFKNNNYVLGVPHYSEKELPNVSILTITKDRKNIFELPINNWKNFLYPPNKIEWIILDDSKESLKDILPDDDRIKYYHLDKVYKIAEKRNLAVTKCNSEYIVNMDDDDYYYADSILAKIRSLLYYKNKDCLYSNPLGLYNILDNTSQIINSGTEKTKTDFSEASMAYTKSFWKTQKYNEGKYGEGYEMIKGRQNRLINLPFWFNFIAFSHKTNITGKKRNIQSKQGYANFFDFFDEKTQKIVNKIKKI